MKKKPNLAALFGAQSSETFLGLPECKDLNNIDLINNLRNIFQDSTINATLTPKILQTMVNTYGLSIYKKSILSEIEKNLEDSFNTAKLTNFVDGLTTDKSNKRLTLKQDN